MTAIALIAYGVRERQLVYAGLGMALTGLFFWLWRTGSGLWGQLKRDLIRGEQVVSRMQLTDKYTDDSHGLTYVLVLGGQSVEVAQSVYTEAERGPVEVCVLPISGTIVWVRTAGV